MDAEEDAHYKLKDSMDVLVTSQFNAASRIVKLTMLKWANENVDNILEDVLKQPEWKSNSEARLEVEENLRLEFYMATMQICEDLIRAIESYRFSVKDPVKVFKSEIPATEFYSKVQEKNLTNTLLLDYLSLPSGPYSEDGKLPSILIESIGLFKEILLKTKDFYFKYKDLYNCYKHGNRFAVVVSGGIDDDPYWPAVIYLTKKGSRNTIHMIKLEKIDGAVAISKDIFKIVEIVKGNWISRQLGTGEFKVTVPSRQKDTRNELSGKT